ncbi:MAG: hypothetical protein R2738_07250 [Bacteroides graminisolvens]
MVPQGMIDLFPMADGTEATDDNGNAVNGYDKFSSKTEIPDSIILLLSLVKNGDMIKMLMLPFGIIVGQKMPRRTICLQVL